MDSKNQFVLKKVSAPDAVVPLTEIGHSKLNAKENVDAAFLDLTKVFDLIDYKLYSLRQPNVILIKENQPTAFQRPLRSIPKSQNTNCDFQLHKIS